MSYNVSLACSSFHGQVRPATDSLPSNNLKIAPSEYLLTPSSARAQSTSWMINKLPPTILSSRAEYASLINPISSEGAEDGDEAVSRQPLDGEDDSVDASLALSLVEVEFEFESDAIGKNLAMPSLSWSGLIDFT